MIRTFIATRIPENQDLRKLHARLCELGKGIRPVFPSHLHVTLKFLGGTDERKIEDVKEALQRVATRHAPVAVRLIGLGAFPHARRPSVVWVGMHPAEPLAAIAVDLDLEFVAMGFAPEARPFQPHLTVLRVKSHPPNALFELLARSSETEFGTAAIGSVELFQSELQQGGPCYTVLASAPLRIA